MPRGTVLRFEAGDTIQVRTPGGGGYGNPDDRSPERIEADLKRGYFSRDQAERQYRRDGG